MWARAGFRPRPRWLKKQPESNESTQKPHDNTSKEKDYLDFWMISEDGVLSLPKSTEVDVEEETRVRMQRSDPLQNPPNEEQVAKRLYDWWRAKGWWGELDNSGSYTASSQDDEDDTTSQISMSTNAETSDIDEELSWKSDPDSGRSTPTQARPINPRQARSPSPLFDHGLDAAHLASLLNPRNLDTRQQARILAHTLTASGITTRSKYQRASKQERTKVLGAARSPRSDPFSQEQEAELLETIIDARRSEAASSSRAARDRPRQDSDGWAGGGAGVGSCVVCQSSPRSVLAWPCRCLTVRSFSLELSSSPDTLLLCRQTSQDKVPRDSP